MHPIVEHLFITAVQRSSSGSAAQLEGLVYEFAELTITLILTHRRMLTVEI